MKNELTDFETNIMQAIAEKVFSPKHLKKIEVKFQPYLLTVRVYKKKGLEAWFSLIEIKRFYELCQTEKILSFRFPWEMTSLDWENKDFIEINFHLN